jgi:alpha-1,3/alpha-1,6-mannosyltransferase
VVSHAARAVVYTPENEHFGIVPGHPSHKAAHGAVEAMYARRPVIACASGGPLESIESGRTGFLCEPTAEAFSSCAGRLVRERLCWGEGRPHDGSGLAEEMGENGRARVMAKFSFSAFAEALNGLVESL